MTSVAQIEESIATALERTPSMQVKGDLLKFGKESQNGYSTYLNCTSDKAQKKWKEYLETKYQAEAKKTKGGLIAEKITMADISSSPLTVTAHFMEDENGSKMNVFYNMNGYYLNDKEHPKESLAVMSSLKDFQKKLYVDVYASTLEEQRKSSEKEQKALDKLKKENEKLAKQISSEESDINKAEETVISSEQKIVELQAKIETLKGEVQQSKSTIEELKESVSAKEKEISTQQSKVDKQNTRVSNLKASSDKLNN